MSTTEYLDLASFKQTAEAIPMDEPIESEDFTGKMEFPIGDFSSAKRSAKATNKNGSISFEITLDGGLVHLDSGRTYGEKYPLRTWVSTKLYERDGMAGKTSSVADYLRKCGIDPKGFTIDQTIDAVQESLTIPVGVFVGRTDKAKQVGGEWVSKNLKTKDFNIGTKAEPQYVNSITIDGETYEGKPKVGGFFDLSSRQ